MSSDPPDPSIPEAAHKDTTQGSWDEMFSEIVRERYKGNLDPGVLGDPGHYRLATAKDLASILDALAGETRDVWSEHAWVWQIDEPRPFSEEEEQALGPDYCFEGVCILRYNCLQSLRSVLEAERWLNEKLGRKKVAKLKDAVAAGIEIAWRVVDELTRTGEVRSADHVEAVESEHIQHHKGLSQDTPAMSVAEVIEMQMRICAELDAELPKELDRFHETIDTIRQLADTPPNSFADVEGLPADIAAGTLEPPSVPADDSRLSPIRLAEMFGIPEKADALKKRLARFREKDHNCFTEVADRGPKDPQFLYRLGSVRHVIEALKASCKTSRSRPT